MTIKDLDINFLDDPVWPLTDSETRSFGRIPYNNS